MYIVYIHVHVDVHVKLMVRPEYSTSLVPRLSPTRARETMREDKDERRNGESLLSRDSRYRVDATPPLSARDNIHEAISSIPPSHFLASACKGKA